MDWWLIPVGVGVVVLIWFVWEAAFRNGETVTAMPKLDGYVPRVRGGAKPEGRATPEEPSDGPSLAVVRSIESGESSRSDPGLDAGEAGREPRHGSTSESEAIPDGEGGIWVEIDIRPLFPSSQSRQIVDLAEVEDPEVVP